MILLGIICGLTLSISIGVCNLSEIIFIIYCLFNFISNGKLKFSKSIKRYVLLTLVFLVVTMFYFLLNVIDTSSILKNVFKYFEIMVIVLFSFNICLNKEEKFQKFLISFLLTDLIVNYFTGNYLNFMTYLHYSLFLLPIYVLISINNSNRNKKIFLYFIAIVLSIIGRSRSSLMVLLITFLYIMYRNIFDKNDSKTEMLKKIIAILGFFLIGMLGITYFTKNLSYASASNMERMLLINTSFQEIKENLILGVGPGNFNEYAAKKLGVTFASGNLTIHNHFLEILTEWGILGFCVYVIPLLPILKNFILKREIDFKCKNICVFYFVFLFFNVLSGTARMKFALILGWLYYDICLTECDNYEKCNSNIKL